MTTVHLEQALRILAREATTLTQEALEPLGISPLQYDILEAIARNMEDPIHTAFLPHRIADRVHMSTAYVGEEARKLGKNGYVRVAKGSSRLLTAKGTELVEECRAALRPVNHKMQSYFEDIGLEIIAEAFVKQQEEAR